MIKNLFLLRPRRPFSAELLLTYLVLSLHSCMELAVVFRKRFFSLWGFCCPIFLAWWGPIEYSLLPSTSNLASFAYLLMVHYPMQVMDDTVSFWTTSCSSPISTLFNLWPSQFHSCFLRWNITWIYRLDTHQISVIWRSKHSINH